MKESMKNYLWIGLPGYKDLKPEDLEKLKSEKIAGVILFKRNFENKNQIKNLCLEIKKINKNLLIGVDQEGGPVQRLLGDGFSKLLSSTEIGEVYNKDKNSGLNLARERGLTMARELLEVGIDLSFAPVVDLGNKESQVLKNRTYSENINTVIDLAKAEIQAMNSLGLMAVIKHFPGHGGVSLDTHLERAVDFRSLEEIENKDLKVFQDCMNPPLCPSISSSGLSLPQGERRNQVSHLNIMASWVIYPEIDSYPACFSEILLQKILREKLKFPGKIFSDDMGMEAAKYFKTPEECIARALKAGCDYVLLCNNFEVINKVLAGN